MSSSICLHIIDPLCRSMSFLSFIKVEASSDNNMTKHCLSSRNLTVVYTKFDMDIFYFKKLQPGIKNVPGISNFIIEDVQVSKCSHHSYPFGK